MFGASYTYLLFVCISIISGQNQQYQKDYFARNNGDHSTKFLKDNEETPHLELQGGDNVQKLVPMQKSSNKYFKNSPSDGHEKFGLDGPAYMGKLEQGRNENGGSETINRVQEITGQLWPMGIVPYYVDKEIYDSTTIKRIVRAMGTIESVSCVIFKELENKPKDSSESWLYITNPKRERDCFHTFVGVDGGIEVNLGFDCLRPEEILHSLLHALGFRDEVTHPQRDQYIRVLWENIQPKYRPLFQIHHESASYKLVEYDPNSIMHFHDRAFSYNGGPTIAAIIPGLQIPFATTLSQLDIMRLKLAFNHECNKRNIDNLLITCKNSLTPENKKKDERDVEENEEEEDQENNADDNGIEETIEIEGDSRELIENGQEKDISGDDNLSVSSKTNRNKKELAKFGSFKGPLPNRGRGTHRIVTRQTRNTTVTKRQY